MGWGGPSPHGLFLEDLLVEDDSGVAIGEQRLRPSGKFREVSLDIFVDESLAVGCSWFAFARR